MERSKGRLEPPTFGAWTFWAAAQRGDSSEQPHPPSSTLQSTSTASTLSCQSSRYRRLRSVPIHLASRRFSSSVAGRALQSFLRPPTQLASSREPKPAPPTASNHPAAHCPTPYLHVGLAGARFTSHISSRHPYLPKATRRPKAHRSSGR